MVTWIEDGYVTISVVENSVLFSMVLLPGLNLLGSFMFTLYINNLADLQLSEGMVQIGMLHMQTIYYCANQLKYSMWHRVKCFSNIKEDRVD